MNVYHNVTHPLKYDHQNIIMPSSDPEPTPLDAEAQRALEASRRKLRLVTPTLGGSQFWGDEHFFHGWKIQKNVFTKRHRLLDPRLRCHRIGAFKRCLKRLEKIKLEKHLQPMSGKCIIFLHGILRGAASFQRFCKSFQSEGYTVVPFEYPSTQIPIEEAARYLNSVIQSLKGITEINFIVHSMGGLVVRAWGAQYSDDRLGRMIMLGTPNTGAHLADIAKKRSFFRLLYGPAGQQLVRGEKETIAQLPKPPLEFAVIAGGRKNGRGYNMFIPGDDDGVVSVESTRLSGAADFKVIPCLHTFLVRKTKVLEACQSFLETGQLDKNSSPQPIS